MELLSSVIGSVYVLNKPGVGNNTHSVSKEFLVPMCILSPNQEKWLERRGITLLM